VAFQLAVDMMLLTSFVSLKATLCGNDMLRKGRNHD
jgi:hypothetical protein